MSALCSSQIRRYIQQWFLVALSVSITASAQEYTTIIRKLSVNGQALPTQAWSADLMIRQEDYVQWIVAVRSQHGDTLEAESYKLELLRDSMQQQRFQKEPIVEYKGLPPGDYTLYVQAQMGIGKVAAPLTIRFRVGSTLSLNAGAPSVPDRATSQADPPFPVYLWIVLALATSGISLVLALLLVQHRRRVRHTQHDYQQLQHELDTLHSELSKMSSDYAATRQTLQELQDMLSERLQQLEHHNAELDQQNRALREQVKRLRASKKRLEELQEEKDTLLSMVIHDVKNPLLIIENLVQLLRNYDSNSTDMHQVLNDLAQTTSRVLSLSQQISRLLAIERSDGLQLELQSVDLAEILRSVIQRNSYLAHRKDIQLIAELPPQLPAECDPQRIEEVFDNVLSNAIKYSHPNSVVFIRASAGDTAHTVEIEDHGVGMSSEDLQRIFERGATLTKPTGGEPSSGIGLWIVRRLVEYHHGSISVRSTKDVGTVVSITLPVQQPDSHALNES